MNMINKFFGKPCKHNHVNEDGLTLRQNCNGACIECTRMHQQTYRNNSDAYKNYQAAYHKKLREESPYKLNEYRATQIEKGNTYPKYEKPSDT